MAVYQYYLGVVPKEGIEKKHDSFPDRIGIYTETGYFESDAESYWKEVETKIDNFVSEIDLVVKRTQWGNDKTSFNWKTYTDQLDNDASIYLDEETLTIREFSFRADLREKNLLFLKNMIELGLKYGWLFFDRKGKLMKPDFEEINANIRNSSAHSFLENPIKFLEKLDKKED